MTTITAIHDEAMSLAERAVAAQRSGNSQSAKTFFRQAFEKERDAALRVTKKREPTRSILLRSAASLALDCGEIREAERLINTALSGDPPDEIADELRDLYEMVNFQRHLEIRDATLSDAEIQLSLAGNAVGFGIAPADEYLPRVQTLESLLIRTAERQRDMPFREKGRVPKAITDDFKMFLSIPRAASFAVTIRLGRPMRQKQLFHGEEEVIDEFVSCLKLFNEQRRSELAERIPNRPYFLNFVHQARKLAPDGKRISTIGLTVVEGDAVTTVALQPPSSEAWQIKPSKRYKTVRIQGVLTQAAKTDKRNVIGVRDKSGKLIPIEVPIGLMNDIVRPLWDRHVEVTGRERDNKVQLVNIVPADEEELEASETEVKE